MNKQNGNQTDDHTTNKTNRSIHLSNLNLADFLNPLLGYSELSITSLTSSSSYLSLPSSSFALNPHLDVYFDCTIGSSYYNGSSAYALCLASSELKELYQITKKLFTKGSITQINKYLNEYLISLEVTVRFVLFAILFCRTQINFDSIQNRMREKPRSKPNPAPRSNPMCTLRSQKFLLWSQRRCFAIYSWFKHQSAQH